MSTWPEIARTSELAEAEPIEPPRRALSADHAPPVDLDASDPAQEAGPALPPVSDPSVPRRIRFYSATLVLALGMSALIHTGVLAFLLERIARPGVEASTDSVSVEIVFEEPPSPTAGANIAASQPLTAAVPQAPSSGPPEIKEPRAQDEAPKATNETPEVKAAESDQTPQTEEQIAPLQPAQDPPPPESVQAEPRQKQDEPTQPLPSPQEEKQPAEPEAVASITLPTENIPVPEPRPARPKVAQAERSSEPARSKQPARSEAKQTSRPTQKQVAAARKPGTTARQSARPSSAASAGGRRGGAAAGELQAYTARLIRHIERHKRYPKAAERQGISGTVGIAITLSREGGFLSARISRSSGQPVLDQEALAATRRAVPYPRPPEGYTGGRVAVSLRFAQGR